MYLYNNANSLEVKVLAVVVFSVDPSLLVAVTVIVY